MNEVFDVHNLSQSQMKIAQWILHNESTVMIATEKDIAQTVGVSIASVSRFWSTIGFKNLKAYKHYLKEKREITPAKKVLNTLNELEYTDVQSHHLNRSIHHLQTTLNHFQLEQFKQTISTIRQASTLFIYAPGPSLSLGELASYRLRRYGINVHLIRWMGSEMLEELIHINEGCAVLLFSFGRLLKEGEVLLKHANEKRCKTIVVSDQLALNIPIPFDLFLYADRGGKEEFHSMIAPLFLMENLIIEIGKEEKSLTYMGILDDTRTAYKEDLPR
ncbi:MULTISPECIES: MurR/RpiR family transcriptional regulator [Bacillus]|uniref:MurR/RpiR family transcriptional regulator n=1 Tax=Bacillus TaxID=1386 RepID=UPI00030F5314|nr:MULTISPECIES: MurR/RpiR family transcriptional regulator [Bacillus]